MVSLYSEMVRGIINTKEKSLEGRICDLSDKYEDIIHHISTAAEKQNNKDKKVELEKALLYLQQRIEKL